ncbi:MAG: family 16 glycosylhydrolase [Planctomycetia bacterium]|nr:family 16 glycosylhydrolase [Planctomycetia bacterium]
MKISFFTVLIFCFAGTFCSTNAVWAESPTCPIDGDWEFISDFSDEFNGESLDNEKWFDFNPAWIGRKPALFSRDNVAVANGMLQLTTREMPAEWETLENNVRGFHTYTTAIIKSKKRVLYGYFETRCRPMASAASSAFWFYDPLDPPEKYKAGNCSEEIDVFELFGKHPTMENTLYTTVHCQDTPYVESIVRLNLKSKGSKWKSPFKFVDDYHVYALLWTPEIMRWFIDGQEVWSLENTQHHRPLHMMFDTEVFETWAGLPNSEDLPSTFYVDYVRCWQLKSDNNSAQ